MAVATRLEYGANPHCSVQWGTIEIKAGNMTAERTFPISFSSFYRATATHIALEGHDSFGINIGDLSKLTVRKTNANGQGTFTVAYLAIGH